MRSRTVFFEHKQHQLDVRAEILTKQGFIEGLDQYEINQEISGDFNNPVCFAKHKITSVECVIKELSGKKYERDTAKHLISEGNAQGSINSKYVTQLIEEFEENKNVYLVTKKASFGNLYDY